MEVEVVDCEDVIVICLWDIAMLLSAIYILLANEHFKHLRLQHCTDVLEYEKLLERIVVADKS